MPASPAANADRAGGVERLGLDRVVQPHAARTAVGERVEERVGPVAEREHGVVDAVRGRGGRATRSIIGTVADRQHLLGRGERERSEPGAVAADQDDRPHRAGGRRGVARRRGWRGTVAGAVPPAAVVARGSRRHRGRVDQRSARGWATSVSLSSWSTSAASWISVPSGTKAIVDAACRRCRSGCCRSLGHESSAVGRVSVVLPDADLQSPGLPWRRRRTCRCRRRRAAELVVVQLEPGCIREDLQRAPAAALETNGWMWITPSPWLWMPSGSVCAVERVEELVAGRRRRRRASGRGSR